MTKYLMDGVTWRYWQNVHNVMEPEGYARNCLSEPIREHGEHGPTGWAGKRARSAKEQAGLVSSNRFYSDF